MKNSILNIFLLFSLTSFYPFNDYLPTHVFIKGNIINAHTNQAIKKTPLFIDKNIMDEVDFNPNKYFQNTFKTNKKGEFEGQLFIDINNPQIWLKVEEFAQINYRFKNFKSQIDTIDLGDIYLLPYDCELTIESYNMPKETKKKKEKYEKYTIHEIDSMFSLDNNLFGLIMNPIDTINGLITRYNFGIDKKNKTTKHGTIVNRFKQVTFMKIVD